MGNSRAVTHTTNGGVADDITKIRSAAGGSDFGWTGTAEAGLIVTSVTHQNVVAGAASFRWTGS